MKRRRFGFDSRSRTNENQKIMAVIYNNQVCIYANELISFNPKTGIGGEKGFMSEGTYYSKVKRGQIIVARRSSPSRSALVYFDTMEEHIKSTYISKNGDPHEDVERVKESLLEREMKYNEAAYTFYSEYRDDNGHGLKVEKVQLYTLQARILDACLSLYHEKKRTIGAGSTRINVWENLSNLVNDLLNVRNSRGEQRYPHKLPKNGKTLKRKADQYEAEGFIALVNKNHGNRAAARIKNEEAEAVMHKLLSQHMNLNNAQIMEQYNKVAEVIGFPLIKSPVTVEAYRKAMDSTTIGHRRGSSALRNKFEMQIKREAPHTAMTYWTLDGWDVELVYRKKVFKDRVIDGEVKRIGSTVYSNRKCMVVVLDTTCKYPIGYAIGDHESPALIRQALRNAVKHTVELFGKRYKPMQIQSDNYQKKKMVPFYEGMTKYYTPAALGNAKSKIIEPYFNYLNKTYCQLEKNWSGVNINASRDSQPNLEILNHNRSLIPDEEGVIEQIERIMAEDRKKKLPELMKAWENTPDERKIPFSDEEYLFLMGDTTGRTNHLTGQGLVIELAGERIFYETFNMELRNHYNEDWVVHYDPDNLSQVLICNAETTPSHRVKKELGDLKFLMQREMKIPMALADQKPEHFEQRKKVSDFNRSFEERYIAVQQKHDETLQGMISRYPQLKSNNLLDRALIIDSRGQHKDRRSEAREEIQEAEIVEDKLLTNEPIRVQEPVKANPDDDEDYEWDVTDMRFSR